MKPRTRNHTDDLRGLGRLAIEATRAVTDLVEAMHNAIGAGPLLVRRALAGPVRLVTAPVYGHVRAVTKLVGATLDVALAQLEPLLGEGPAGAERDAIVAALNGVLGDYLAETRNPLAIEMQLMHRGHALDLDRLHVPDATGKLLVLVHGSAMSGRQWRRQDHDHGAVLADELGYTATYLHYNSGRHISTNGRELAALLERLARTWPVPLEEIVLLGHSMGGLVARSACHHAEVADHAWRPALRSLICIGSPHHGAPLERAGNWLEVLLGVSRYSAPLARLGQIRSAGITDMRYGNVRDEHWEGRDRFAMARDVRTPLPLPAGVACYAIAGTTAAAADAGSSRTLPGDGMVPVDSALGRHERPELTLEFSDRSISFGTGHLDLLARSGGYETLRGWLAADGSRRT